MREGFCDIVSFVGLRSTTKVKPELIPVAAFTSNKTAGRRKKATQKPEIGASWQTKGKIPDGNDNV